MKNKKLLSILLLIGVVVLGGITFAYSKMKSGSKQAEEATPKKKRVSLPEVEYSQAPYVLIEPVDSHNISLSVIAIKQSAQSAEYELEYQAGSLLQGAFGELDLGSLPVSEKILLGSCSAGGACTYHEDVQGGSLLARFTGGESDYQAKADWKYIDNAAKETEFSSKDGKFQLVAKTLASHRYLIIFNGFGYPTGLTGTADSSAYTLTTSSKLSGQADLTIRANSEEATKIVGYDGATWHEFTTTKDGKMLTATVDLMQTYLAVK